MARNLAVGATVVLVLIVLVLAVLARHENQAALAEGKRLAAELREARRELGAGQEALGKRLDELQAALTGLEARARQEGDRHRDVTAELRALKRRLAPHPLAGGRGVTPFHMNPRRKGGPDQAFAAEMAKASRLDADQAARTTAVLALYNKEIMDLAGGMKGGAANLPGGNVHLKMMGLNGAEIQNRARACKEALLAAVEGPARERLNAFLKKEGMRFGDGEREVIVDADGTGWQMRSRNGAVNMRVKMGGVAGGMGIVPPAVKEAPAEEADKVF